MFERKDVSLFNKCDENLVKIIITCDSFALIEALRTFGEQQA